LTPNYNISKRSHAQLRWQSDLYIFMLSKRWVQVNNFGLGLDNFLLLGSGRSGTFPPKIPNFSNFTFGSKIISSGWGWKLLLFYCRSGVCLGQVVPGPPKKAQSRHYPCFMDRNHQNWPSSTVLSLTVLKTQNSSFHL